MVNPSVSGLSFAAPQGPNNAGKVGRNQNLNDAYLPPWDQTDAMQSTNSGMLAGPMGDTRFDPFAGTQWGRFLDTLNAQAPGGIKTPSGRGDPLGGLKLAGNTAAFQTSTPTSVTRTTATQGVDNPMAQQQYLQSGVKRFG